MSTLYWRGDAPAVAQMNTFAFGGTWEASDLIRVTCNGKTKDIAAGSTTTATVVENVVTAFNALSATTYPELAEVTASSDTTTLTFTADIAGKPFAIALTPLESNGATADSQTIEGGTSATTGTAATANAGPNVWSTAGNWSGGAIPADGDTVILANTDVDILYGIDQTGVVLAALAIDQSYNGRIGLSYYNEDGNTAYVEYRQRYLKLEAAAISIGQGEGPGSPRILLHQHDDSATTLNVYSTGQPQTGLGFAVIFRGGHASNVVNVNRGTVGIAVEAGDTAAVATLRVGYVDNLNGDSTVRCGAGVTLTTINQSGGRLTTASAVTTANVTAGEFVHVDGAMTTLNLDGGACRYRSSGTLTTANVGSGANLDFRQDMRGRTVTNLNLHERSEYHDPFGTVTLTNGADFVRCTPADVTFDVVPHRTWSPSAI